MATKDAVLDRAVDLAREAALEIAEQPADVGEHLGSTLDGERLVSHRFACEARGYRGWQWTVTLARVPRGRVATVCEAVLLPGPEAILAKEWLPWSQRLQPGDIGPGDVLPFRADDPRLVPGWTPSGDEEQDLVAIDELALARERILSPAGRDEAAMRWYRGAQGPTSAGALAATAACSTCGFLVSLQGSLGQVFGVCANEWSPEDGRVVSLDHGCGAHSQTDVEPEATQWPEPDPLIDDLRLDLVAPAVEPVVAEVEPAADVVELTEPVDAVTEPAEPDASVEPTSSVAIDETEQPAG
ncbi:DUF3027 domain-containing protein [Cellulomonas citrea]|uniref:DUF3027 domain-containing protein n=1 Tax=Cellulomonas citrea TaxID=1909423 RepID=UPI00135A4DFB|nr:DUF3027 domain-containing protein [Cellulomonas citrea]